ncbi:MAG TPA: GLPGLI family protein [Bacteroidales bacterium]|nr:GLPGLI family protein [Bacteroidales bacterium]
MNLIQRMRSEVTTQEVAKTWENHNFPVLGVSAIKEKVCAETKNNSSTHCIQPIEAHTQQTVKFCNWGLKAAMLTLAFWVVLLGTNGYAQIVQGVIKYELRTDIHRNIPAERQDLRNMMPQYRTDNFQLFFSPEATTYKPGEEPTQDITAGGGNIRMAMRMPRNETHIDRNSRVRTVSLDFMGRNILIVDTLGIEPWRFGRETMQIAGYTAMMAWYKDTVNNMEVTAWFTPQLPPFQGPDRFVTLPGTVLAVDINNGERVWVARGIEQREVTPEELSIRKPNRAEVMSRAQFNAFLEGQRQRMNQNAPGAGAMLRGFGF